MDRCNASAVPPLIQRARDEGDLSAQSLDAILLAADIGAQIQAGLGVAPADVPAAEVTLVTMMPDDSGSIWSAGNDPAVRAGHNEVLDALERSKQGDGVLCWQEQGRLLRRGRWGPEIVGDVLAGQTRLWAGATIAFGVSRAGPLSLAFLFRPAGQGINDGVALPRARGRVVEEHVAIAGERVWHVGREAVGGGIATRCTAIDPAGRVLATRDAVANDAEDDAWLAEARGFAAAGPWLFAVTDDGIVRIGVEAGQVGVDARYPDTAPFVADPCTLPVAPDGLHVVGARDIVRLVLASR